eukprot:3710569-Lingulodinium_polyedra.AAC.1
MAMARAFTLMCPSRTWPRSPSGVGRPGSTGWQDENRPNTRATRARPWRLSSRTRAAAGAARRWR